MMIFKVIVIEGDFKWNVFIDRAAAPSTRLINLNLVQVKMLLRRSSSSWAQRRHARLTPNLQFMILIAIEKKELDHQMQSLEL